MKELTIGDLKDILGKFPEEALSEKLYVHNGLGDLSPVVDISEAKTYWGDKKMFALVQGEREERVEKILRPSVLEKKV